MSAISTWYDHLVGTQLSSGGVAGVLAAFVKNVSYKLKLPDASTVVVSAEHAIRAKRMQLDGMHITFDQGQTGKICSTDGVSLYSADYKESGLVKIKWTHDAPTTRTSHVELLVVLEKVPDLLLGVQFYKTYDNDELYLVTVASSTIEDGEKVYRLNFEDGDYDYMKKLDLLLELAPAMPTERTVRLEDLAIYSAEAVTAHQAPSIAPDAVTNVKFWGRSIYVALGQKGTNVIVNDLLNTDDGQPGEAKATKAIAKLDILVAINGVPIRGRPVEEVARMINACTRPLTLSFRKPKSKKAAATEAPPTNLAQNAARLPTLKVPIQAKAAAPKPIPPAKPTPEPTVEAVTQLPLTTTAVAASVVPPSAAKPTTPTPPVKPTATTVKPTTPTPTVTPATTTVKPTTPTPTPPVKPTATTVKPTTSAPAVTPTTTTVKPTAAPINPPPPPPATTASAPIARHEPLSSSVIAAVVDSDGTGDQSAEADDVSSYETISEVSSDDDSDEEERPPTTTPSQCATAASPSPPTATPTPNATKEEKAVSRDTSGADEPSIKAEKSPSPSSATKKRPATDTVSGKAIVEQPSGPKKLKLSADTRLVATESPSTKKLPLTSKPRDAPSSSSEASPKETDLIGSRARRPRRIHVLVHKASLQLSLANIEPNQFPIGEVETDGRVQIGAQLVTVNGQSTQALSTSQVASLIKHAPRPVNVSFLNANVDTEKS
ncbi:hypothetical protein SPRG_07308 [Saprolegnia parasitica CBS 223.65]|uniref:PDZ domain-containing protein n=1 Tax=Saprolegnia parasitica (strain CBS 223.65) TaxID=695850 RepID=A0A067CAC7_SAPPC|nr:hypothetical protein SPRG_07308 [Saprolegnia parasitica CBS 223.65]KDO27679.1 hypothetical protein SPRG_07308 [Saprolegnia parasitica CBS 223.65]|eukprot:XP_012201490.1 hypothetical protein SPRG_07308 [Saprolegnia parasitica CBS 223.65]